MSFFEEIYIQIYKKLKNVINIKNNILKFKIYKIK